MMRLLKVELDRFRSRRVNQLAVLGIVAVALVTIFGTWQTTRPASAAEIEQAQAWFESDLKDWEENGAQWIAECKANQEANPGDDYGCDTNYMAPTIENYSSWSPSFAESAPGVLPGFGLLLVFAAFAMGVSFIAAEFSSGSIGNWLTFEPRRGRVYGTKVGASGISVIPIALAIGALLLGGTWLASSINGNVGTVTSEIWRDVGDSVVRLVLLTIGFAVLGVAMGTIVRHAAAAVGIIVGYAIIVEGIIGSMFVGLRPWLLNINLQAVLHGGTSYWKTVCESLPTGEQVCNGVEQQVSLTSGAVTLSVVLVVLVAVAAVMFRRRDVN